MVVAQLTLADIWGIRGGKPEDCYEETNPGLNDCPSVQASSELLLDEVDASSRCPIPDERNHRLSDLWSATEIPQANGNIAETEDDVASVQTTMERFCFQQPSTSEERSSSTVTSLPGSQGQISSRRSIMPHDIGRQWSAVHSGDRADRSISDGNRRREGQQNEAFSGRMLTRARGIAISALLRDPQSSAATTVCNTDARRGIITSSDSDDFTTPIPVRRRNTVGGIVSRQEAIDNAAAIRWSTPAPTHDGGGLVQQQAGIADMTNLTQNENEKRKPRRAKPLIEITPTAMTNPVTYKGLASDEPANRKRGWSMENSGENLCYLGDSFLSQRGVSVENLRAKRVKITDAVPI